MVDISDDISSSSRLRRAAKTARVFRAEGEVGGGGGNEILAAAGAH